MKKHSVVLKSAAKSTSNYVGKMTLHTIEKWK